MRYAYVNPQSDLAGFSLNKLFKKASRTISNLQPALQQVAAGNYAGAAQSAFQTWATGGKAKEGEPSTAPVIVQALPGANQAMTKGVMYAVLAGLAVVVLMKR